LDSDTRIFIAGHRGLVGSALWRHFSAVGQWYADFSPTSDREVIAALAGATRPVHRTC